MFTSGCRKQNVARESNIHPSTISRLLSCFRVTGQVSNRQHHGRQRKTTVRQDLFIVTTSRCNLFMSAPKVTEELRRAYRVMISNQSVSNMLLTVYLRAWRPLIAVPLTQRHRRTLVAWATTYLRWIQRKWNTVLFTEEFGFCRWTRSCLERTK